MTKPKDNRGGKRPGSGRKKRDTAIIYLRHDKDVVEYLKLRYGAKMLNEKIKDFLNQLKLQPD